MRKIIEYTLVSVDGVFAGPALARFGDYRDEAYFSDGLNQLLACDAMLMGRTTYEQFSNIWPARSDPWADRVNTMTKYVFSSTLKHTPWENSVLVPGDVETEVTKLKQQGDGNLIVYGHGMLAQTLLKCHLLDILDLAVHPIIAGTGERLFRETETATMKLAAAKSYSQIVKLTYETQYPPT
jgi:dihydrofolate reductase